MFPLHKGLTMFYKRRHLHHQHKWTKDRDLWTISIDSSRSCCRSVTYSLRTAYVFMETVASDLKIITKYICLTSLCIFYLA